MNNNTFNLFYPYNTGKRTAAAKYICNKIRHDYTFWGNYLFFLELYFYELELTTKIWGMRLPLNKSSRSGNYIDVFIGDGFTLDKEGAAKRGETLYGHVLDYDELPPKAPVSYTYLYDNGFKLKSLSPVPARDRGELSITSFDQLKKLTTEKGKEKLFRISPYLILRVYNRGAELTRSYYFRISTRSRDTTGKGRAYHIYLGELESISFDQINAVRDNLIDRIAEFNPSPAEYGSFLRAYSGVPPKPESSRKRMAERKQKRDHYLLAVNQFLKPFWEKHKPLVVELIVKSRGTTAPLQFFKRIFYRRRAELVKPQQFKRERRAMERTTLILNDVDIGLLIDSHLLAHLFEYFVEQNRAKTGHRLFTNFIHIVDYAEARGDVRDVNFRAMKIFFAEGRSRNKIIQHRVTLNNLRIEDEIRKCFGEHIVQCPVYLRVAYELLFYTLLRVNELLKIRWENIFLSDNPSQLISLQNKTLPVFKIPLVGYGLELVKFQQQRIRELASSINLPDSEWLLPSPNIVGGHLTYKELYLSKYKYRLDHLDIHGIRSVGGSFFSNQDKIDYTVGMAVLQHSYTSRVQMAYERNFLYQKRIGAMASWGNFLRRCIGEYSVLNSDLR